MKAAVGVFASCDEARPHAYFLQVNLLLLCALLRAGLSSLEEGNFEDLAEMWLCVRLMIPCPA
jgi:hypothetical protein